jgi:hypothetical protein
MYHGTSTPNARKIVKSGLAPGSYVTPDFELAASYALRTGDPAVVCLYPKAHVSTPEDPAYEGVELVTTRRAYVMRTLRPKFQEIPADWYELTDGMERKYPDLFERENWR